METDDDEYMTCSPVIEVVSGQDVTCVAEDVTTMDDEIGRNDDGSPECEWISSSSDEDAEIEGIGKWTTTQFSTNNVALS